MLTHVLLRINPTLGEVERSFPTETAVFSFTPPIFGEMIGGAGAFLFTLFSVSSSWIGFIKLFGGGVGLGS